MRYSNLREERKNVTKKKEEKTHINYLMIGFSLKDVVEGGKGSWQEDYKKRKVFYNLFQIHKNYSKK
jgi:hypothetical protein